MRSAAGCIAGAAVLAAAGIAAAASDRPSLHVRPATVAPGEVVAITGNADDCPRGDAIFVLSRAFRGRGFAGVGAVTVRVGPNGRFSTRTRIRAHIARGVYTVTARCGGGNLGVEARLRVT